jgi:predicted Zn-dependent protease
MKKVICCFLCMIHLCFPVHGFGMTVGDERRISEKLLFSVRAEFDLLDSPDISQYLNELGDEVLAVAGPQFFDYNFFVVKNDQFNAFAAPGGLVFFYAGLIQAMKNENELVGVLAHEIAHVVARHISRRIDKGGKINAVSLGLGLAALALGMPEVLIGSMAAGQAVTLHYSREDEEEADRLAFAWMRAMGRDPAAMESMLRTMRRISRFRSEQLPQYLLTHPNPEFRIDYIQSLLETYQQQGKKNEQYFAPPYRDTDNFRFLRFQYRIMIQAMDHEQMRIHCINLLSGDGEGEKKIMAGFGLSLLAGAEHNFVRAEKLLREVIGHYPEEDILYVDLAVLMMNSGNLSEAVRLLEKLVKRNQGDPYALFELARAREKQGQYDEAEKLFLQVALVMPKYARLWHELARIKSRQNLHGESRFYLAKHALYRGRIEQAKRGFEQSAEDENLQEQLRREARETLSKLKELENI